MERDSYLGPMDIAIEPVSPTERPDSIPGLFLIELFTLFASRKWLIAMAAGIGMLVGVVLSLVLPAEYTSTTRIMTPHETQSTATMLMNQLAGASGMIPSSVGGALGLRNPNDLYVGILGSRTIADALVKEFNLQNEYRVRDSEAARKKLADETSIRSEKSSRWKLSRPWGHSR